MVEKCGATLLYHESLTFIDDDCRICQDIKTKGRRLQREQDNVARWQKDGRDTFRASIEKSQRECRTLEDHIRELWAWRPIHRLCNAGTLDGESTINCRPAGAHPS